MRITSRFLGNTFSKILGRPEKLRIAIVGTQASGKTVFLTSLIAHLKYHETKLMNLGDTEILKCETLKNNTHFPSFPYDDFRTKFVYKSAWPSKSLSTSEFTCRVSLQQGPSKKRRLIDMEFLDFPGERSPDFQMYFQDYCEWSDAMITSIECNSQYTALAKDFLLALKTPGCPIEKLISTYKVFLGNALCKYSRLITPSTFLLDTTGKRPDGNGSPETWSKERLCGLRIEEQFVPLPLSIRTEQEDLTKTFDINYCNYKEVIVKPLIDWIKGADQMLLLEDVTELLMCGPDTYNDVQGVSNNVLSICDKNNAWWIDLLKDSALGALGWPVHVEKIGVVATKTDLVSTNDDVDNMESLTRKMLYKKLRGMELAEFKFFTCAAIKCTERTNTSGRLKGRLVLDTKGNCIKGSEAEIVEFPVSDIPEDWPNDEDWHGFNFPEVYPKLSAKRDEPPQQEGLERIVKFIFEL